MGIFYMRVFVFGIQEGIINMTLAAIGLILSLLLIAHRYRNKKEKNFLNAGCVLIWTYFIWSFGFGRQGGILNRVLMIGFIIVTVIQIICHYKTKALDNEKD